jgi:hypothetical protein
MQSRPTSLAPDSVPALTVSLSAPSPPQALYFPAPSYTQLGFWGSIKGFFGVLVVSKLARSL